MKKVFNAWNGFIDEINSTVSERDCKRYSLFYSIIALIMGVFGVKKNRWYLLGTIVYGVIAAALYKSYKAQRSMRWEKELNELEPVEK